MFLYQGETQRRLWIQNFLNVLFKLFFQKDFALTLISQPVSVRAISIDAFLLCFQVQIVVELSCTGRRLLQQLFYPLEYRHFERPIKEQTFFFRGGEGGIGGLGQLWLPSSHMRRLLCPPRAVRPLGLVFPHPLRGITCWSRHNKLQRLKPSIWNLDIVELISGGGRVGLIERVWCNICGLELGRLGLGPGGEGTSWKCRAALQRRHQMWNPRNSQPWRSREWMLWCVCLVVVEGEGGQWSGDTLLWRNRWSTEGDGETRR